MCDIILIGKCGDWIVNSAKVRKFVTKFLAKNNKHVKTTPNKQHTVMKFKVFAAAAMMVATVFNSSATPTTDSPLGNLLGGLAGNSSSSDDKSNKKGSNLGDILGGVLGGLISTDDVNPASMTGVWKYAGPAVCFKSDNFLQKAGGAAAAGVVEGKLESYYKKFRLDNMVLTINEDLTFTMQSGKLRASGTVEKAEDGDIIFTFQALKSIKIGSMKAYVTMTGKNSMSLMFDVSKLITIVKTVGSVTGSSSISTMTKLLESYDGICAGFKLTK